MGSVIIVAQSANAAQAVKKAKEGIVAVCSGLTSTLADLGLASNALDEVEQRIGALALGAKQYKDMEVFNVVSPFAKTLAALNSIYPAVHPNDDRRSTFSNELSATNIGDGSGNASWTMPMEPPARVPPQRPYDSSEQLLPVLQSACPGAINIVLGAVQAVRDRAYAALGAAHAPLMAALEAEERYRAFLGSIKQTDNPPAGVADMHLASRSKCKKCGARGCAVCAFAGLALPPSATNI